MHSRNRTLLSALLCLTTAFASSCNDGLKFDPDFYVGDRSAARLVNEKGISVYAWEEKFDSMACLTPEKVEELRILLLKSHLSDTDKKSIIDILPRAKK